MSVPPNWLGGSATIATRLPQPGGWITSGSRAKSASDHIRLRLQYLGEMIEAAERTGDARLLLQAHHSSWSTRIWDELASAIDRARRACALRPGKASPRCADVRRSRSGGLRQDRSVALWALGWPDQAVQSVRESIVLGEALDHLPSLVHSLWFAASVYFLRRKAAAYSRSVRGAGAKQRTWPRIVRGDRRRLSWWALIRSLTRKPVWPNCARLSPRYATTAHVSWTYTAPSWPKPTAGRHS